MVLKKKLLKGKVIRIKERKSFTYAILNIFLNTIIPGTNIHMNKASLSGK